MTETATAVKTLFEGIASLVPLFWTGLFIYLVYYHREALKGLVASLGKREFTIKIGQQELSFKQYREQQAKPIEELDARIESLEKQISSALPTAAGAIAELKMPEWKVEGLITPGPAPVSNEAALLWVDDVPENNALLVESFQRKGIAVELAKSTEEGLERFSKGGIVAIISDMGRREDKHFRPKAGLDFLKQIREIDKKIPFLFYTSSRSKDAALEDAAALNARITTSFLEVSRFVRNVLAHS